METAPTPRNPARTLRGMGQRELEIGFAFEDGDAILVDYVDYH